MIPVRRSLVAVSMVAVLAAGVAAVAAARWTQPVAEADEALAGGEWERALSAYAAAQSRFDRAPALRALFARDYARVVGAELALAYRLQRFDAVTDMAQRAPEAASPHFWAGLAYFAKSRGDARPEEQSGWLMRAEEELRRAVATEPDAWDVKYDFELVSRLAAALRKAPRPPDQIMQLLRPQQRSGTKTPRHAG